MRNAVVVGTEGGEGSSTPYALNEWIFPVQEELGRTTPSTSNPMYMSSSGLFLVGYLHLFIKHHTSIDFSPLGDYIKWLGTGLGGRLAMKGRGGWHHPESFTKRVAPTNKDSGVPYDRKQLFQVAEAAKVAVPPTERYNSGLWTDPRRCIWGATICLCHRPFLFYCQSQPLSAYFHHCVTKGRLPSNANLIEPMFIEYRTRHTHRNESGTTRCKEFPQLNRFDILSTCRHKTGSV